MGRPAAPVPLPVWQHYLEGRVGCGRLACPVDERERLRGGERGGRRGEHGVAGLRHRRRAAGAARLREDGRPGRIPGRLAEVHAARAGGPPGPDERPDHPDRLVSVHKQVRHSTAHQLGDHHRVGPAGEHGKIGLHAAVVVRADLPRHPVDRAGHPGGPAGAHIGGAEPAGCGVGRPSHPAVGAAHPGDTGRREERRDAGAHPACAVDPGERRAAAGEHRRTAIAMPVGQRRAGQLWSDPLEQIPGQRGTQAGGKVVEHPGRGQQAEHPVHRRLAHAVRRGGRHHGGGIAGPVEQAHDGRSLAQPGQRPGPSGIDTDLERVTVAPERSQSRLECWSHAHSVTSTTDIPAV
jgi:hypothetical protein